MDEYTIYCTPEQTDKALELGAPIEFQEDASHVDGKSSIDPTAEQMFGWLEEQGFEIDIIKGFESYVFNLGFDQEYIGGSNGYNIRKEATLAAIDAALEYLENLKQQS